MICRNCGTLIPDGNLYCSECGERVFPYEKTEPDPASETEPPTEPYEKGGYPPPYSFEPPVKDKAPTVKDYLKWMLLYPLLTFIPGIGLIIYIVICVNHALDKTNVARANFFKATLISFVISIAVVAVVVIIFFALFAGLVASGASLYDDVYSDIFNEFAYGAMRMFF